MGTDFEDIENARLTEEEEAEAIGIYQRWKDKNIAHEEAIDRFMQPKVRIIKEIIECGEGMTVKNGKVERIEKTPDNEELRLLREQNDLLKQLLIKQQGQ